MSKFEISQHAFTSTITEILQRHFGEYAEDIFQASPILGYLNNKTKAANRGSKARGAFANHYALYVVVEDYIRNGFADGTFVVKSDETSDQIRAAIRAQAVAKYKIEAIVDSYMAAIEEIINVKYLVAAFDAVVKSGQLQTVMNEIVVQSKVEFNYNDDDEDDESE